jgi:hypothetical protein
MIYGKPKKLSDGRYYLKVSNDDGSRIMHQMNKVKLLTKFDESDTLTLELPDSAIAIVDTIDNGVLAAAKENCMEWFEKELKDKTLDSGYVKGVRDGVMLVSKAMIKGAVVTKVYAADKSQCVDTSLLESDTVCDIILEFSGVSFTKKSFSPIWRIAQARMIAPKKKMYPDEYLFQDSEEQAPEEEEDTDYI